MALSPRRPLMDADRPLGTVLAAWRLPSPSKRPVLSLTKTFYRGLERERELPEPLKTGCPCSLHAAHSRPAPSHFWVPRILSVRHVVVRGRLDGQSFWFVRREEKPTAEPRWSRCQSQLLGTRQGNTRMSTWDCKRATCIDSRGTTVTRARKQLLLGWKHQE